jgi:serine/threonine-protein kinase
LAAQDTGKTSKKPIGRIGGYDLLEKVGQGGMGTVYLARQPSLDRTVAVKILKPSLAKNETYVKRFLREARSAGQLNHPNIVQAVEVGEADGYYFFAMEYIDGRTLRQVVKENGPLPEERLLEVAEQMASALAHAWQRGGMIHRDVKPHNIMVTADGSAKLMDMGLAKSTEEEDVTVTQAGRIIGSPSFASPEQLRGEVHDLDIRTDIYSLGCTLFHAVTGKLPFEGPTAAVTMARNLNEPLPKVRELRPELSEGLEYLIARMTEKDRERRFAKPEDILEAIRQIREGSLEIGEAVLKAGSARPGAGLRRRPERRRTRGKELALFGGLVLVAGFWGYLYMMSSSQEEGDVPVASATTTTTVPAAPPSRETTTTAAPATSTPPGPAVTPEDRILMSKYPITRETLAEFKRLTEAVKAGEQTVESAAPVQETLLESVGWAEGPPKSVTELTPRLELLGLLLEHDFILEQTATKAQRDWVVQTWRPKEGARDIRELLECRRWLRTAKLLTGPASLMLEQELDSEMEGCLAPLRGEAKRLADQGDCLAAFQAYERVVSLGKELFPQSVHEEMARLRDLAGQAVEARRKAWRLWLGRSAKFCAARDYAAALPVLDAASNDLEALGADIKEERSDLEQMQEMKEAVKGRLKQSIGQVVAAKGLRAALKSADGEAFVQSVSGKDFRFTLGDLKSSEMLELASTYLDASGQRERLAAAFLIFEGLPDQAGTWLEKAKAGNQPVGHLQDKAETLLSLNLSREFQALLEDARSAAAKKEWDRARAALQKVDQRFAALPEFKEHGKEVTALRFAAATLGGSIETLFHGQAKSLGGTKVELLYDLTNSEEFADWGYLGRAPGALVTFNSAHTLAARFLLEGLQVECEAMAMEGEVLRLQVFSDLVGGWIGGIATSRLDGKPMVEAGQVGEQERQHRPFLASIQPLRTNRLQIRVSEDGIEGQWDDEAVRVEAKPAKTGYLRIGMTRKDVRPVAVYDRIRITGTLDPEWVAEEFRRRENQRQLFQRLCRGPGRNRALKLSGSASARLPGHFNGMKTGTYEMLFLLQEIDLGIDRPVELLGERIPDKPTLGRLCIEPGSSLPSFSFGREKGSAETVVGLVPLNLGEWHHFAVCWDSKGARIYVDGCLCGQNPKMTEGIPATEVPSTLTLGVSQSETERERVCVWVDEIRLSSVSRYDRNFEPTGTWKPDRPTLLLFHCDEGEGMKAVNASNETIAFLRSVEWVSVADATETLAAKLRGQKAAEKEGTVTLRVPADRPLVETGVLLRRGERFSLRAQGRWQYGVNDSCGPQGTPDRRRGHPKYGLVGQVYPYNRPFFVGTDYAGAAEGPGLLQLMINDDAAGLWDNDGFLAVRFSRQ